MNVALDYDDTYTRDPQTWRAVVNTLRAAGHSVFVVTLRDTSRMQAEPVLNDLRDLVDAVFFTACQAKASFMLNEHNILIHVWIDDNPFFIMKDAS